MQLIKRNDRRSPEERHAQAVADRTKRLRGCSFRRLQSKKMWLPNKVHVWTSSLQQRCQCGKLDRDDPRLEEIKPGEEPYAQICGLCGWHPSGEQEYLSTGDPEAYYRRLGL